MAVVRPFLAILVQETCSSARCEGRIPEGLFVIRHLPQNETVASRRALLRGIVSSASVLALGGCASLGATGARYDASSLSVEPTLIVATTRKAVNAGRTKPWFGPERATRMTVARAKLVAPDESRFSLAAAGFADWRLDAVEPVAAEVGDLLAQGSGARRADLRAWLQADIRDSRSRCRASRRRHQIPRPDDGVLLAVQSGVVRLRL